MPPADGAGAREEVPDPAAGSPRPSVSARPSPGDSIASEPGSPSDPGSPSPSTDAEPDRLGPAVVFLGTSLSAGYGLSSPDSAFPARIARRLEEAGHPYRVVNAGLPGETSAGGLRRVSRILDAPALEILVLELGANDGLRGLDTEALQANLRAIVDSTRARHPGARVLLAGMEAPPNLGPDYTERFRSVYRKVAQEYEEVHLVPFLLDGVAGVDTLNLSDGIHPNARGHRRVAELLWRYLEPLL